MTSFTRSVHNLQHIPISREFLAESSTDSSLARDLVARLMESPRPPKDQWGLAPFRELWVLFTPESETPRELPEEILDSELFSQWLNAFSLVSPKEEFLASYQSELQSHLGYLFEGDQLIERKSDLLYRIVAS